MPDGRTPRDLLCGELAEGIRARDRPSLRFKDDCERDMKAADVDPGNLEEMAKDRNTWRQAVRSCVTNAKERRLNAAEERRQKRKLTQKCSTVKAPLSS